MKQIFQIFLIPPLLFTGISLSAQDAADKGKNDPPPPRVSLRLKSPHDDFMAKLTKAERDEIAALTREKKFPELRKKMRELFIKYRPEEDKKVAELSNQYLAATAKEDKERLKKELEEAIRIQFAKRLEYTKRSIADAEAQLETAQKRLDALKTHYEKNRKNSEQFIQMRLKYMCTPLMLIDLFAISPFYIFGAGPLRILRIFRIFMLMRYTNAIQLLNRVVSEKKKELAVCAAFILMLWIWSSFMIYRVEHIAQPDRFRNMLDAFWWSAITFTTLGYGDIYPVTFFGRIIAVTTAVLGLILFAITTAVLTAGIIQELKAWDSQGKAEPPV